jgi:hypothetical protein
MEQVLDVYKRPYDPRQPVVCMDESPRQLIRETRLPQPSGPGVVARYDYEYERRGVCNIFLAVEPLAGRRLVEVNPHRTKQDWALFLAQIARCFPDAQKITLVMDNLEHSRPRRTLRSISASAGQGPMGPLRIRVHAQTRQLA